MAFGQTKNLPVKVSLELDYRDTSSTDFDLLSKGLTVVHWWLQRMGIYHSVEGLSSDQLPAISVMLHSSWWDLPLECARATWSGRARLLCVNVSEECDHSMHKSE